MNCPECGNDMGEPIDSTFSNVNSKRCKAGDETGEIYRCEVCNKKFIHDWLDKSVYIWRG